MHESNNQFRNTLKVTVTREKTATATVLGSSSRKRDGVDGGVVGRTNGGRE